MYRQTENKIVLITRQTRLKELVRRFNSVDQAKFYIEHSGGEFEDYVEEDKVYEESLTEVSKVLTGLGRLQVVDRPFLTNFVFGKNDVVVVLGQDGLVANTAKYLDNQVLVGVNPDPARWDGVLLPFNSANMSEVINQIFESTVKTKQVTMAKVELNDGQKLYAINDLFIGTQSHSSARYSIKIGDNEEFHSSSGVIVSTGLGATGWLASILAGAKGVVSFLLEKNVFEEDKIEASWDMEGLFYSVREPFPSIKTSTNIVFGKIGNEDKIILTSLMPENGVIFSDGIENDYISFNSGVVATIGVAEKKVKLAVK